MVEVTADRLSFADQTKTKLVNYAVQVVVKTDNKSVNDHYEFANVRYDKQTQVTDDNNRLSFEEDAKFKQDWKERGWFMLDTMGSQTRLPPTTLHAENYARSNGIGKRKI